MNTIVIGVMAFFMTLGALDRALFDSRFGYGKEFEKGLNTMGPLTLVMVGTMCAAPALGGFLGPLLGPFFESIGSDPAMVAGVFLGPDNGGFPLAKSLARSPEAAALSGIGLASTLGSILTFALPISLSVCSKASQPYVARGIVASLIASPLSMAGVGLATGCPPLEILRLGAPVFAAAVLLAAMLTFRRDLTVRLCLRFAKGLIAVFIFLLAYAALDHYFSLGFVPGMAPIEPQFAVIGEIGIMLAGAFPLVLFIQKHFTRALHAVAQVLRIDDTAVLGMFVSCANPLPMYSMLDRMSNSGKVVCSAFSGPVLCLVGDHLGFFSAAYPEGITPLLAGKLLTAFAALALALLMERLRPSRGD